MMTSLFNGGSFKDSEKLLDNDIDTILYSESMIESSQEYVYEINWNWGNEGSNGESVREGTISDQLSGQLRNNSSNG